MNKSSAIMMAAVLFFALIPIAKSMSPESFGERINNFMIMDEAFDNYVGPTSEAAERAGLPPEGLDNPRAERRQMIATQVIAEYKSAFIAKENGDVDSGREKALTVIEELEELKSLISPRLDLEPLIELVREEFGFPSSATAIAPIATKTMAVGAMPTVKSLRKPPDADGKLFPTISPSQYRGKKNIFYALMDIVSENFAMLGVFLIGMLILYALYRRDNQASPFG